MPAKHRPNLEHSYVGKELRTQNRKFYPAPAQTTLGVNSVGGLRIFYWLTDRPTDQSLLQDRERA